MKINQIVSSKYISLIPSKGYLMATYYDRIIFNKYEINNNEIVIDDVNLEISNSLKEIRLFNKNFEYRLRYINNEKYENVFSEEEEKTMDRDLIYVDEMLLKEKFKTISNLDKIVIINRYRYTDYNTMKIFNLTLVSHLKKK